MVICSDFDLLSYLLVPISTSFGHICRNGGIPSNKFIALCIETFFGYIWE